MAIDRDKVLQAALKLVEKKRYDKAILEYQKLVADDPRDVRTLLKVGDLYLKLGEYVEAVTTYEQVGRFYSIEGFALKAVAVYKRIREIILKHAPPLEVRFRHVLPRLAEIYVQLGLTSDALAMFDEVATRLQRAGRDRDAVEIFEKIIELDPANPLPHLRLAEAHIRSDDVKSGIQQFGVAADILLKLGRREDALKVLERLLTHRPDAHFARLAAQVYLQRDKPNDAMSAVTKLQIAFTEDPKDLDTLEMLAQAFDQLGQPAKAIEVQKESARVAKEDQAWARFDAVIEALVARAPEDPEVRQLASTRAPTWSAAPGSMDPDQVSLDSADLISVRSGFSGARRAGQSSSGSRLPKVPRPITSRPPGRLAGLSAPPTSNLPSSKSRSHQETLEEIDFFTSQGMIDEAQSLLGEQLRQQPNHPVLLERRRELEALGTLGTGKAGGSGSRFVSRPPSPTISIIDELSVDVLNALNTLDAGPQAPESVRLEVAPAVTATEAEAAAHYDLGIAYREMGLYSDAISELRKAANDPGRTCECESMIGVIRLQMGSVGEAIQAFHRGLAAAVKTENQELVLTYELGVAYESQGALTEAREAFAKVAELSPGYQDARGSVRERLRRIEERSVSEAKRVGKG